MADRSPRATRAGRGLTTRGRCLLAGGVAAVICAFVLNERDLLRVGFIAIALPLLAIGLTSLRRSQITSEYQVLPDRLQPGTRGQVVLRVTNVGMRRTGAIEISEAPTPGLTLGMHHLLAPIRAGQSTPIFYPLFAERRGRFLLGPPTTKVADPFDLWEDHRELAGSPEILVVPTVVALVGLPRSSGATSAASGQSAAGSIGGDPDVGVRPYVAGDDIRTIHWRASARHDDLVVRVEEPVSHGGATLLLDHRAQAHAGEGISSSLETAVVMVASAALHLLGQDRQVRLVSHTGALMAEGADVADDVLAALATVQLDDGHRIQPPTTGRSGLVIAVVGEMTEREAVTLAAARPASVNGVALVLQTTDWWAAPGASATASNETMPTAAQVLGAAGWRTVVIRRGADLSAVWQQACASRSAMGRAS